MPLNPFVMDSNNKIDILQLVHPSSTAKVKQFGEFETGAEAIDIPDPYYGDLGGFYDVYELLDKQIEGFVDMIKSETLKK